jgi:hypothetical protein
LLFNDGRVIPESPPAISAVMMVFHQPIKLRGLQRSSWLCKCFFLYFFSDEFFFVD